MNFTYTTPFEGEIQTIKLKGRIGSIGLYEDTNGNMWDVESFIGSAYTPLGKPIVHARLKDSCPIYSTANGDLNKGYHISYIPYYVEYIN